MAYITLANTNKIIFNSDFKNLNLNGEIYKLKIYFFSKYEENSLLAIKELLMDPEKYFNTIYIPYEPKDSHKFIYEGKYPSYHKTNDCPRLNSNYENYEIPIEIREKGLEKIKEFREWFQTVKDLLDKPDVFVMRLQNKWGITTNPKSINKGNSGTTEIIDYTIEELEKKIDEKIKEAGVFYYKNEKNTTILRRFSQQTFLAYRNDPIKNNNTGYTDDDVKSFLNEYDLMFKIPIKRMLIEYYRLKFNPEIKMEGSFLEKLGFKQCYHCYSLKAEDFGDLFDII